ncbi:MAG: hypothetical protein ACI4OL_05425 [Gemmiger sp.]
MKDLHNDQAMDEALKKKVAQLQSGDDETGDGVIDAADLKAQLDRIEAQLELQDAQNRTLLRHSRLRFAITAVLVVVLCIFVAVAWVRTDAAYQQILDACQQIDTLAGTVQQTMDELNTEDLNAILDQLPALMETLNDLDTDSINAVMERLPATMDAITALQQQFANISGFFGGLTGSSR